MMRCLRSGSLVSIVMTIVLPFTSDVMTGFASRRLLSENIIVRWLAPRMGRATGSGALTGSGRSIRGASSSSKRERGREAAREEYS